MAYINFKEEKAKGKFQLDERKKNNEILYKSILKHKDSLTGFYPNLKYSFKKIIDENIGKKGVLGEEDFQEITNEDIICTKFIDCTFKNIPRDLETKQKIAQTLRKQRWNGSRFYKEHANRLDTLYLCRLKSDDLLFYKIGRTFGEPKRRCGKQFDAIIQIWQSSHKKIVDIEGQVLLTYQDKYGWIAPNDISGRTECFTTDLPIDQVCQFIDMAISSQAKATALEGSETTGEVKSS